MQPCCWLSLFILSFAADGEETSLFYIAWKWCNHVYCHECRDINIWQGSFIEFSSANKRASSASMASKSKRCSMDGKWYEDKFYISLFAQAPLAEINSYRLYPDVPSENCIIHAVGHDTSIPTPPSSFPRSQMSGSTCQALAWQLAMHHCQLPGMNSCEALAP